MSGIRYSTGAWIDDGMIDEIAGAVRDVIAAADEADDPDTPHEVVFRTAAHRLIRRLERSGIVFVKVTTTKETVQ